MRRLLRRAFKGFAVALAMLWPLLVAFLCFRFELLFRFGRMPFGYLNRWLDDWTSSPQGAFCFVFYLVGAPLVLIWWFIQYQYAVPSHPPAGRRKTCPACGYDLTGNTSGICPECGTPVP